MAPPVSITVRNLHFQFDAAIPRHWHGGQRAVTALLDSHSLFFPLGERFFVDSVKESLPLLQDPELRKQARLFCGQEGIHQREHDNYNRMLEARGYPAVRLERWVSRMLRVTRAITLPRWRLAITCGLEHFTATAANRVLTQPSTFAAAHPHMRAFWRWHAAEEIEHKSIPFDMYQQLGGHYVERVVIMFLAMLTFRTAAFVFLCAFLWTDRALFSRNAWSELFAWLAIGGRDFFRDYRAYYRPGFHPQQLDSTRGLQAFASELTTNAAYASLAP
jgi:uncharacterized protein